MSYEVLPGAVWTLPHIFAFADLIRFKQRRKHPAVFMVRCHMFVIGERPYTEHIVFGR